MRKSFLVKAMAFAVMAASGGAGMAYGKFVQSTIWVYQNGDRTADPDCDDTPTVVCATQYFLNPNGSLGAPTGQVRTGVRNTGN